MVSQCLIIAESVGVAAPTRSMFSSPQTQQRDCFYCRLRRRKSPQLRRQL